MIKNINFLFVTFFGIGTVRYAPGTITSLITTALLYSSFHILNLSNNIILIILIIIFLCSFRAVAAYTKENSDKDPKEIVIDEVIGQSIPIYIYEIAHGTNKDSKMLFVHIHIILFRFLDIKKPFEVNFFDRKFKNSFV